MKEGAMDHYSPDTEFIIKYIKELKLPTVKDSLDDIVTDAVAGQWGYRKLLRVLFQREVEQRIENRKYARIRKANFPHMVNMTG
jgi:DNA replication protein DnaC